MPVALIVDDDPIRHRFLGQWLESEGYRVAHVRGYYAATSALSRYHFDLVMLDHDLCFQQTEDGCYGRELTGFDVAQFIAEMPARKRPGGVIVHSWNTGGARKMFKVLRSAGIPVEYQMSPA